MWFYRIYASKLWMAKIKYTNDFMLTHLRPIFWWWFNLSVFFLRSGKIGECGECLGQRGRETKIWFDLSVSPRTHTNHLTFSFRLSSVFVLLLACKWSKIQKDYKIRIKLMYSVNILVTAWMYSTVIRLLLMSFHAFRTKSAGKLPRAQGRIKGGWGRRHQ